MTTRVSRGTTGSDKKREHEINENNSSLVQKSHHFITLTVERFRKFLSPVKMH
jgi:hypothetical protein